MNNDNIENVLDDLKHALIILQEHRELNRGNKSGRYIAVVCTMLEQAIAYLATWAISE